MENILEKINKVGLKVLAPLTLQQTYDLIVREAVRLVNAMSGALYVVENGKLTKKAHYPANLPKLMIKPSKHGFTYRTYKERKALVVSEDEFYKTHRKSYRRVFIKSFGTAIFIPISYHHKSIGALSLISPKERRFNKKELELLKAFGAYASLAISKSQFFEDTQIALSTRDLFISMAAHEFRTPLTTINGYVQLLRSKATNIKTQTPVARWLEELSWETTRLTNLVNELLQVNRMNIGQLQYIWREIGLVEVINKAIVDFRFTNPKRKLVFENKIVNGHDLIIGDFDKLHQVVTNLLENAAKFSAPGTKIIIKLDFKSPNFVLSIQDFGRGIPRKDMPKIFQSFYRGRTLTNEGMGLGLYLAKNIIEQHHGLIKITSKLRQGTTVIISLPGVIYAELADVNL